MAFIRFIVLAPRHCPGSIVLSLVHEVLSAAPNRCPPASTAAWALPAASYGSCPRERPTSLPGVSAKSRQSQIERGKPRHRVLRALAYKWQRILFRCWQNHEAYDEERYIAALRRRHSPLIARIDSTCADAA